ncbi:MAG: hypothetical protein GOVbin631_77 [Prokaryotic dsDNA virus sp.]|nr:MAG: hypothetical protein GOVbin631_77 [Prokaryotic dsDNA virus sp.]|tara:strand:+ start:30636 stop:30842 length:207 start_codon:yes stop_codon:yes gene_type:complete
MKKLNYGKPIDIAVGVLVDSGFRAHKDHEGNCYLDGRLVMARDVVIKANKVLEDKGMRKIRYPGVLEG